MNIAKIISKIAAAALGLSLMASCYADLSTSSTFEIPEINVDGLEPVMYVVSGDHISLNPTVTQEGRTGDDFTYLWRMDSQPNGGSSYLVDIGDEPSVDIKVSMSPSDKPYVVLLTITDKTTGYNVTKSCELYVSSALGEGILVAHTHDGGQTTDFDLITAAPITYGYESSTPRYTRNIYSLVNDVPMDGRVNAMLEEALSNAAVFNVSRIYVGTESHIIALDPLTFEEEARDEKLFGLFEESSYATSAFVAVGGYSFAAIVDGSAYGCICNGASTLTKIATGGKSNFFRGDNIAFARMDQGSLGVFDETSGAFRYIRGWQLSTGALSNLTCPVGFDANGAVCIGAGGSTDSQLGFLLRDSSGQYHICILNVSGNNDACTHYSLSVPENIDKAVSVAFCDNCNIAYYATPDKIYSILMSGGKATVSPLTWKPESSDERITSIKHYTQGWYGTHQYYLSDFAFQLPANRLQMIITTYNEKTGEGKLYLRPFNVSTGRFTMKDNGTYYGFGEITATCSLYR